MSRQTVNLDTYSLSLLTAKEDILNPRSSTNWALFAYEGVTNKLKLADSGAGGVAELAEKFHISKPQYGLCKVGGLDGGPLRIALIGWVGENVDDYRRNECATHIPAIKHLFKEAHAFISAEKPEDVTEDRVRAELSKTQTQAPTQWVRRSSRSTDKEEIVGTNYRKTNAAMEMRLINRDSFWALAEREEEQRKEEERRRATEERRRLERERVLKERKDTDERDRKMNEKLQMIEEQRRKQREEEEEQRKKEKLRWEQQQKEHEEDMRARLRRSESIEKAAEAAALVSQRSMNPREFFRQLSSSSSQSPTSPGSSRSGKPFRRYQRSLTDTAFIFSKAEETSPHTSPLVSPFSRAPPSPVFRAMSPTRSPDFYPVTSPRSPRPPMSPPTSPIRPAPPVSSLPSIPQSSHQVRAAVEPQASEPTVPSAPPASPSLLDSAPPTLMNENIIQLPSEALLPSALNIPTRSEQQTLNFEPFQVLTDHPQLNTEFKPPSLVNTKLVSDTGFKVQAVLVEADEEEDLQEEQEEEDEMETQPEVDSVTTEPAQTETDVVDNEEMQDVKEDETDVQNKLDKEEEQEEEGKEHEELEKEEKQEEEKKEQHVEEDEEEQPEEEDNKKELEEYKEEADVESKQETDPSSLVEPAEMLQVEEEAEEDKEHNIPSADSLNLAEPADFLEEEESVSTDHEPVCQDIKHDILLPSTNWMTNGDDTENQNGTVRSLSPADTDGSTSESPVCYRVPNTEDEEITEDMEKQISKNGQEDLQEQHMCVRALYDYQAEDESELSFQPGDIIRDVETVDKAWWRGWGKDGRQGLFPANYVETI